MAVFTLAQFQNKIKINGYSFALDENLISSKTGGGVILTSSIGPRLWNGNITCADQSFNSGHEISALISQIQTSGNHFEFSPIKSARPISDPNGTRINAATVRITTPAIGYTVNLSGLPANFVITAGDYFSYLINGTNRIHQFAETKTATAAGVMTAIKMVNPLINGAIPVTNTIVNLVNPSVTVQYVPGSMKVGGIALDRSVGWSFDFIQSVKV